MNAADPLYDQARVTVLVRVPVALAFQIFTEEIDRWWRRGLKYRMARGPGATLRLEPGLGGRLLESDAGSDLLHEAGKVITWEPPRRLVLKWRVANFAPGERTEVEVELEPTASGTRVTVTHRGFSALRGDHPVRHGQNPDAFVRSMGLWWGELLGSLREHALTR